MFTVHIDFGRHDVRDFDIKDNPARSRQEAASSLCRLVGGLTWEVRQTNVTVSYEVVQVGANWAVRRHSDVAEWNAETELWINDRIVAVYDNEGAAVAVAYRLNLFAAEEV